MSMVDRTLTSDGHSQIGSRGRIGYSKLQKVSLGTFEDWNDDGQRKVLVCFMSNRMEMPGPCHTLLSFEDARTLAQALLDAANDLTGKTYVATAGPRKGHTITVLGRDGLFPDEDKWTLEANGHKWGVSGEGLREYIFQLPPLGKRG